MRYYSVAELTVTDRGWVRDYVTQVTPMVERYGGRYLARTAKFEQIEGERAPKDVVLLIEWPSKEAAEAVERTTFAVVDLPLAVLTRHLRAGTLTRATGERLAAAVGALLS